MTRPRKRAPAKKTLRRPRSSPVAGDRGLRDHLLKLLDAASAHANFEQALRDFPEPLRGFKPGGAPYTPWQLLEHMRIAQSDILEFTRDPKHVSPAWPEGYWPKTETPPSAAAWDSSVRAFRADLATMKKLVADSRTDLFARIPHGTGQTILREALLLADHNAYHLGQFILLRRLLSAWPAS